MSRSNQLAQLLAHPAGRRAMSAEDLEFFDTHYCGMRAAPHRKRWLQMFSDTRARGLKTKKKARLLLLAPRDHGKTEACISFALREILLNRNVRILWICESSGQAKKRVLRLRKLLQSEMVEEDWCRDPEAGCVPLKDSESKWTETQIYVKRSLHSTDPTLEATGSGGAVTGGHFDIIVCHERGTLMLHEGDWIPVEQHPSFKGFRKCVGHEVKVWGVPFSEVVTPEHRYWARARNHQKKDVSKRGHCNTAPDWVEARDLTEFHMIGNPIDETVVNLFPAIPTYKPGTAGKLKGGGRWTEEVPEMFSDPEWWWALGLWWGDGHLQGRQLAWSCAHARPEVVTRLKNLAAKYNKPLTKVKWSKSPGAMDVYLWADAPFSRWLKTWYTSDGKVPPSWVEQLGPEYQRALLRGYLDADGYVTSKDVRLTSVGLQGLLMVRRMLARQGIASTIRAGAGPRMEMFPHGKAYLSKQKYDLRFQEGRDVLGYAPARDMRSRRDFIEGGFLWSKIRSLDEVGEREFAPIKTAGSTYVTSFGLSHNCDDLEDNKTVYSENNRMRTRDWFKATVSPMLVRDGAFIIVGTRKHHDDIYAHLLKSPTWSTIRDQAIIKWPDNFTVVKHYDPASDKEIVDRIDVEGESDVLWKKERDIEYLLSEREEMTPLLITREMQNEVQDDESAPVKMEWLEQARDKGAHLTMHPSCLNALVGTGLTVVQGWDLALVTDAKKAQSKDRDYTVGCTWAKDEKGNRYLLDIQRFRGVSEAQLYSRISAMYYKWNAHIHVGAVGIERNNFGELHFVALQRATDLPLKPHLTTGRTKADPWDGVPALRSLFENGKVILASKTEQDRNKLRPLISELWGLGSESHDDTVMSLWITECVLRRGGFLRRTVFGGVETALKDGQDIEVDQNYATQQVIDKPWDPFWNGIMDQFRS